MRRRDVLLILMLVAGLKDLGAAWQGPALSGEVHPKPQGMQLELTKPFHTRSPWHFVVTEGAPTKDYGDVDAPGALTVCLRKGAMGPCVSEPVNLPLRAPSPDYAIAWEPHYLIAAKVVY